MLNEGKVEIQRIKKGVDDAKAIANEVSGFWGWLRGFFSADKPPAALDAPPTAVKTLSASVDKSPAALDAPASAKKKQAASDYIDHIPSEDEIVDQFLTHFSNFLEAQTQILDGIAEQRQKILNVWEPTQNNRTAAVELIRYERRINDMALELSSIMAGAPIRLGSVREQFEEKFAVVVAAQRKARDAARRKEAQSRERVFVERNERIERNCWWFASVLSVVYFWWFMWSIWQSKPITG